MKCMLVFVSDQIPAMSTPIEVSRTTAPVAVLLVVTMKPRLLLQLVLRRGPVSAGNVKPMDRAPELNRVLWCATSMSV